LSVLSALTAWLIAQVPKPSKPPEKIKQGLVHLEDVAVQVGWQVLNVYPLTLTKNSSLKPLAMAPAFFPNGSTVGGLPRIKLPV
jgi:hypothetical protein